MRVTLKQISEKTGYSVNTVSHALRGLPDISESTAQRIRDAAAEMGYIANAMASSMRSGKSGIIAVIVGDITNPLFSILVRDLDDLLTVHGYCTIIFSTDENEEKETQAIECALSRQVDGIILCPTQTSTRNVRLLQRSGTPFVLQGRFFSNCDSDHVLWDDKKGMYLACRYLLEKGHSRIAYLSAPLRISGARLRLDGYLQALEEAGQEPSDGDIIVIRHFTSAESIHKRLQLLRRYDAVLCFNDIMAYSVLSMLPAGSGIEVVGFDNIQSRITIPCPLTTVHTPKKEMSEALCRILLDRIRLTQSGGDLRTVPKEHITIDVSLHVAE